MHDARTVIRPNRLQEKRRVSVLTPVHSTPFPLLKRSDDSLLRQTIGFSQIQWVLVLHNCGDDYAQRTVTAAMEQSGASTALFAAEVIQGDKTIPC